MTELTGVIPIAATPFDSEGRIERSKVLELEARLGRRDPGPATARGAHHP